MLSQALRSAASQSCSNAEIPNTGRFTLFEKRTTGQHDRLDLKQSKFGSERYFSDVALNKCRGSWLNKDLDF